MNNGTVNNGTVNNGTAKKHSIECKNYTGTTIYAAVFSV